MGYSLLWELLDSVAAIRLHRVGRTPPGNDRTAKIALPESGANMMQAKAPVEKIAMYLDGFHADDGYDPKMQMEAHHHCNHKLSTSRSACCSMEVRDRLMGLEYIISKKVITTLSTEEKACWPPHNYETLSGQLRMPGFPDVAEKEALKGQDDRRW